MVYKNGLIAVILKKCKENKKKGEDKKGTVKFNFTVPSINLCEKILFPTLLFYTLFR